MLVIMTANDLDLLRAFARDQSQDAFTALVQRHLDLVYCAALRQVRSPQLAEEIAQSVFADLARHAAGLKADTVLTAWLYQVTRRTAIDVVRREARRQLREQIAFEMNAMNAIADDWAQIEPLLDEAMHALNETDRTAVLLRYFENKSLREMGETLGMTDDAARKRVSRAVERLREFFSKQGVNVGASGLVVVISANAVQAAPIGLAITISTAAVFTGTTIAAAATATKAIAMTTLQKSLAIAAVAILTGTGIYEARQASQWRAQAQMLQQQQVSLAEQLTQLQGERDDALKRLADRPAKSWPRLPAPRLEAVGTTAGMPSTNVIARMLKGGDAPKLTGQQVESYLKENQRNAASLLAAYRSTGDAALLQEAMQKFSGDPQVAFEAAFRKDVSAEERRQWLDALKLSAPQNAFADYLSAADHFKGGQSDQAVQDLIAASGKTQFQDYTLERVQDDEEAYRAAGYSVAEAKTIPATQLLLPQLAQMKELSENLGELAKSYRQASDESSAQAVLRMAASLGQRYSIISPGEPEISQLVGIAMERIALNGMDANSPYDGKRTVKDRLEQLAQQSAEIRQLAQQTEALQSRMTEQDWISYKDRWRNFGEEAAGRWLINKYGQGGDTR
jgi:RNA polymerase sigma factor (sigma-70 family)